MIKVTLTGTDGSGKSTLAGLLARELESALGRGRALRASIWEVFDGLGSRLTREDLQRYLASLQPVPRLLLFAHVLRQAEEQVAARAPAVLIQDGNLEKYAAMELARGGQRPEISKILSIQSAPGLTFWLDLDPEAAWERKLGATDYELGRGAGGGLAGSEGAREEFLRYQSKVRQELRALASERGTWTALDATEPPQLLAARVARAVLEKHGASR
jgi:thymidylate kinase